MTTSTNIKINIVEPGNLTPTPTPVGPSTTGTTDISVPDTGLFTHGIGAPEATIIAVSVVSILAIAAIVSLHHKRKTNKKAETSTEVTHKPLFSKFTKFTTFGKYIKSNKKISIPLAALALVVSLGTLAALLVNAGKSNTNAADGNDSLTLDVSSEELTIEVADSPVFAVLPVELTVEEATVAGYTLTASTDSTDLVSTTNPDNIIPMVAVEEDELTALEDNTWGLALDNKPASKDEEVYTVLSTDADNPTFITDKYYEGTGENDKTTIYYGFYITPDTPKGTYEGSVINYEAKENTATVVFDGNGKFYFDGDTATTTSTMSYIPGNNETRYSHTPNVNDEGVQDGMYPLDSNETFVYEFPGYEKTYFEAIKTEGDYPWPSSGDYFSIWSGSHPNYTALNDYDNTDSVRNLNPQHGEGGKYSFYSDYNGSSVDINNNSITIAYTSDSNRGGYGGTGYGYYAKVIGYNPNIVTSGEYEKPTTDGAYRLLGWSEDKDATTPTYKSAADIERALNLTAGETVTLYAISEPAVVVTYNGNGADSTTNMDNVEQYTTNIETTSQVDLLASNFTKSGHGFVGWSTDTDAWTHLTDDDESNNPTIYGPNQMITVDPSTSTKLTLYAVWAPAETDNSGNPISLQDWQGCSTLTTTTYTYTGALNVGKNTITALTDSRDGNIYTVARLADGNCWMTENLRLDNNPELSQQNTNNPSLPLTNNFTEQTTSNSLSATSDDWCTSNDAPCYNQSKLNTNNTTFTTISPAFSQDFTNDPHDWRSSLGTNISSYSNYYNWYSATAGNGAYDKSSGEVSGDICPAGWMLPIGKQTSANGSFSHLDTSMGGSGGNQYTSSKWRSFPNNFVYSGNWGGSSASGRGSSGCYWSSTAGGTDFAYYLSFSSGYVSPGTGNSNKYGGSSVRCVAPAQ